jgi:hypothetical protein
VLVFEDIFAIDVQEVSAIQLDVDVEVEAVGTLNTYFCDNRSRRSVLQ